TSRRVPPFAAGRADAATSPGGAAPEAPALIRPHGSPGAGASPLLPRPGDPPPERTARSGPGQQPWYTEHPPPGTPPLPPPDGHVAVWDGSRYHIHRNHTAPLPAVRAGIYGAYETYRDQAEVTP